MRRREDGFTLLEVMVAVSVMAVALTVILNIITNNVRATARAKMITSATFLARAKVVEIEDRVLYQGFGTSSEEQAGDFSAQGFPQFRWDSIVERVELPTDISQQVQNAASDTQTKNSTNPMAAMAGFLGGFMSTLIEPIRVGLQESVRRVTVRVYWDEGQKLQSFEVVTFMTDPSKLDLALNTGGLPTGAGGAGGAGGAPGGTAPPTQPGGARPPSPTPPGGPR